MNRLRARLRELWDLWVAGYLMGGAFGWRHGIRIERNYDDWTGVPEAHRWVAIKRVGTNDVVGSGLTQTEAVGRLVARVRRRQRFRRLSG